MKLSFDQIKEITTGAVAAQEENGMLLLKRFTQEQEDLYKETKPSGYEKTFSTSGIKFLFKTDSENLFLKLHTAKSSTRKYFSVDVFVDGCPIGYIDNFSDMELPRNFTKLEFPLGDFLKNFQLGKGDKTVCVHLPWSVKTLIDEVAIDDNAFIEGIKPNKKLLLFGDSVTHGYDTLHPSNRYAAKLANLLDAEEFNKGIGGECFFPELAKLKDPFVPDYITIAYGSNDWSKTDAETFKLNSKAFYENIAENYPNSKIFTMTPIWRQDMNEYRKFGEFKKVEEGIKIAVKDIKNITVISAFEFIPHDEKYFADIKLHPSDEGYEYYIENLYKEIKTKI